MTYQLDLESDLLAYPNAPGWKSRETSAAAAAAIAPRAQRLRDRVFSQIKLRPSTPEEVAERLGEEVYSIRPRFSELARKGLIEGTAERREAQGGRLAMVWREVER